MKQSIIYPTHLCAMPQVTFWALAELRIQHTVFYGLLAQFGLAHYPLLYHFCSFVHIPIPDPVPPCVSCFQYLVVSHSPPPIPVLNPKPQTLFRFTSHHIPLVLFLFPLLFPTLCPFPMALICPLRYLYVQNFMYVSSVWNWHRLSLLNSPLSIPNLRPSKLRTRECPVAKHQSLSSILVKPCCWPSSSAAPESLRLPCSVLVRPRLLQFLTLCT